MAHFAQLVAMKESRNVQNKKERRHIWTIDQGAEDTAADNYKSGRAPGPSIPLTLSSAACFSAGGCLCCSNRRNRTQQPEQLKPGGMESGAAPQEDGVKVCRLHLSCAFLPSSCSSSTKNVLPFL